MCSPSTFFPLCATALRDMWISYLPKLAYPVRSGVHSNTAFALRLSLDYAREVGDSELEEALVSASKRLYEADKAYDPRFEPSGEDFLSPGVCELLLMRSVLAPEDFPEWATSFMPSLGQGSLCPLLQAPKVLVATTSLPSPRPPPPKPPSTPLGCPPTCPGLESSDPRNHFRRLGTGKMQGCATWMAYCSPSAGD
jgi:hypothetical protein